MIHYEQFPAPSPLSEAIECFWVFKADFGHINGQQTLIPGGRIECMFSFAEPLLMAQEIQSVPAFIMGQRDRVFRAKTTGDIHVVGARLKPGGLSSFSTIPASALLNRVLPIGDIIEFHEEDWMSALSSANDDRGKISILERLLLSVQLPTSNSVQEARSIIFDVRDVTDIESLEAYCAGKAIHYKKLERIFLRYVGYTPKTYLRILRFNKALRKLEEPHNLTSLAHASGYYDQSHFIRDFRRFAGVSPGQFDPANNPLPKILMNYQVV